MTAGVIEQLRQLDWTATVWDTAEGMGADSDEMREALLAVAEAAALVVDPYYDGQPNADIDALTEAVAELGRAVEAAGKERFEDPGVDPRDPDPDGIGEGVLGRCFHGVDLDREFCPKGCRV